MDHLAKMGTEQDEDLILRHYAYSIREFVIRDSLNTKQVHKYRLFYWVCTTLMTARMWRNSL